MHTAHPFDCEHSTLLVLLSYTISVLGAYCGLHWAALIPHVTGWARAGRVAAAAVAMGGGAIWSMHFIAMIACRLPVPVSYDLPRTLASMAVAILATGLALHAVATRSWRWRVPAAGIFAGLGVAAMHYTGMAAMQLPARMVFVPSLVAASIAIAIVAATAALWISFAAGSRLSRVASALVMGVAVSGMHYTAMAAVTFLPADGLVARPSAVNTDDLAWCVFAATLMVLGLLGIAGRVEVRDRQGETRVSDLAGANESLRKEIDERLRIETALREAEERATSLLEWALDAVVTMDETGAVTTWNAKAEQMFGWSRREAVGARLSSLIIPEAMREAHERGLRHYLATGEGPVLRRLMELSALHRDGHEFRVELAISAGRASGRPVFCGFIRDITERKRAEDALHERTVYLNTLIEHSPVAIVALDPEHRVRLVNPAFERLFLYSRDELIGHHLDPFIAEPGTLAFSEVAGLTSRVLAGESVHLTMVRRRKDGQTVDVEMYGVPLTANGRINGIYAMYHDITGQRQLEEQLRQSQKIEAVGTLAGGIAHDFNNLLTTILGYSDLVLDAVGADDPIRSDLEEIKKAGQQAASLTRQLLAFSRKQIAVFKVLDLNDIVRDMDNMLRRLVGEHIAMTVSLQPASWCVKVDRGQIGQVLLNLAINARDAMPHGGTLAIAVRNVTLDGSAASAPPGIAPGRYVTLTVSDTGVGMDDATRLRIFEPFFSTKPQGRGTGLGLSTVYGILKQSGGHITVDSAPGRGSSFTMWLPEVQEPLSPREVQDVTRHVRGTETILLVEDDDTVRRLARTVLSRQGYHILEAANGDEALRIAAGTGEPVHLILSDGVMPGITVGAMIAQLRASRPDARVLVMSGYTSENVVLRGILDADIPFLQKPFTGPMLLSRVREVLDAE